MAKKKAFTLIELLVVIGIIAILAAVVLVSLGGAQDRAKDARITSDMNQLRNVAEIYKSENGSYTGLDSDSEENTLATDIAAQGGTYVININGTGTAYCAQATLNSGKFWCIDSNLTSKQFDATTCSATDFICD